MKHRLIILAVLILINTAIVLADDIKITRDLVKELRYNNELKITLSITNNFNSKKTF